MKIKTCLIVTVSLMSHNALACDGKEAKSGYWFYEDCVQNEETKEDPNELAPLPTSAEIMKMPPKKIREMLEERKEYALWKQTPEAVKDYYVVQDAARRLSVSFTALTKYVMMTNPELNANSQYPTIAPARNVATQMHKASLGNALMQYRNQYALAMFTTKTCPYCKIQRGVLKYFSERHGWNIKEIDIEERPDIASRFNATVTPMTIVIQQGSDKWMPVSVGAESLPNIENGVYRAVRLLSGEITPQQYLTNEYDQGGFFDPNATQEAM